MATGRTLMTKLTYDSGRLMDAGALMMAVVRQNYLILQIAAAALRHDTW
jgi:hypothetical protein